MYYKLEVTKTFKKDIAKLKFSNEHYGKYIVYLASLLENKPLPPESLHHKLKGQWSDFMEFHISGDLLVIYRIDDSIFQLIRIGSHSQLFD